MFAARLKELGAGGLGKKDCLQAQVRDELRGVHSFRVSLSDFWQ